MSEQHPEKSYEDGLEDAARVCEYIAAELQTRGMGPIADGLLLAAKQIRKYEPGFLPDKSHLNTN